MDKFKKLREQRAAYQAEMQGILDTAESEERAMNEEETSKFDELEKKIKDIDATIKAEERARDLTLNVTDDGRKEELRAEEIEAQEERAFANYIRGVVSEERASNLEAGSNGAVVPKTIANKIIKKVYDICPIYQLATRYNVGGTLAIPYYDES